MDQVALTSNSYKLLGSSGNELLLEQACAASLDQVQIFVDFVCAVKGDVQSHGGAIDERPLIDVAQLQARLLDQTL